MPATVRTIRHGTLRFVDGAANSIIIPKMDGGVSDADMYSRGVQAVMDRGSIAEAIYLDDELLAIAFAIQFSEFYGEGAAVTVASLKPWEFLLNDKNNASATLTKVDATQDPFNINVQLTKANPLGAGTEVITWQKAIPTNVKYSEGYPDRLSFSLVAQLKNIVSTIVT